MSRIFDALRRADEIARGQTVRETQPLERGETAFRVVSVTSNKGGVGKTTVATNLAVYARALREDLPILIFSFDDQSTLDRTFQLEAGEGVGTMLTGVREGSLDRVIRPGQYGVDYVRSCTDAGELRQNLSQPEELRRILQATPRGGLVVIDTKSDFEVLTRAAIEASDLVIVPIKDQASLEEARRVFDLLADRGKPLTTARVLLSLVDLRVKYREGEDVDVLAHLITEIRREGYPLFETFLSRSPKVESLHTNPEGRAVPILHGAPNSVVHTQMLQLTEEVLQIVT